MGEINQKQCTLKFIKVKGHSSNKFNNMADELAVNAKMEAFKTEKTTFFDEKSKYVD